MPVINPLPNNILNGDPLDATAVMANFNQIVNNVNTNAAALSTQNTFAQPQNGVAAILPAQFTILSQVQGLIDAVCPIGTLLEFAGSAAPNAHFDLCDGAAISRTTYAALFAVIGTTWGAGDGVTTFNKPDFRRASAIGSGGTGSGTVGNATGNAGGAETHVMTGAELVAHSHGITDPTHAHSINDPGHNHPVNDPGHAHSINDPAHSHGYTAPGAGTTSGGVTFFGGGTQAAATNASGTGISIFAALTGIFLTAVGTSVSIFGAATGITVNNAGSSAASNLYHPVRVVTKIIRNGL